MDIRFAGLFNIHGGKFLSKKGNCMYYDISTPQPNYIMDLQDTEQLPTEADCINKCENLRKGCKTVMYKQDNTTCYISPNIENISVNINVQPVDQQTLIMYKEECYIHGYWRKVDELCLPNEPDC